jgi:DNA-nicking Smr family endonuclease
MANTRASRWLTAEDLDLFHRVLADVTPRGLEPVTAALSETNPARKQDAKPPAANGVKPAAPKPSVDNKSFPAALADHGPGKTPGLDKRSALRLRRGQTEIDGRIDLHGMTQAEARSALSGFVTSGYRQDRRCLLVITGKGRRPRDDTDRAWSDSHEPGVIRRMVPRWLEEAPLVGCVLAYSPAQPRHGGSGALYVLLKRRRGP